MREKSRTKIVLEDDEVSELIFGDTTKAPKDKFGLAWMIFTLLGVGVLFPWNAFITALDYFGDAYSDFPFAFAITLAYNYSAIFFLFISIRFGPKFSFSSRIYLTFGVTFIIQVVTPFISNRFGMSTDVAMGVTLGLIFITGSAIAILFGAILGFASLFPPSFITAVMIGNGIAGILAGVLRIITKAAIPGSLWTSAMIYFEVSGVLLVCCALGYFFLLRLPITKHYLKLNKMLQDKNEQASINSCDNENDTRVNYFQMFKRIGKDALVVWTVFFVTLTLFPGITGSIESTTSLSKDGWFAVLMIFCFQFFDFIGRSIPIFQSYFSWTPKVCKFMWSSFFSRKFLWIPTFARFLFFALFIFCIDPLYYNSDGWYFFFMAVFAVSNGYLGTLAMMYGPTGALDHEKEVAGIAMSFFLNFGIFCAAHFALVLRYAVFQIPPWE
eukprot:CAMPEP_0174259476 /NCGR_PEP_ID=MMETSP0439-20130205/8294_1 /TAXON_ID=0 /ORGANISM="Stereomyxa ramosa, Strain Chinc5" /LENGTH=440 /DNA_ID=CAMNT_0015343373 /DNA_START=155 /DNA_END=1477 /DNA_ORIENTATION=-